MVGASGCGKSSLVRAGMMAALEAGFMASAGARWRLSEMHPSTQPLARLAQALLAPSALGPERSERHEALACLASTLRRGPLGLVEALRETPLPERTNLLILVDQFEEIFRYREGAEAAEKLLQPAAGTESRGREAARAETDAFVALLLASKDHREFPIFVVITMRSDFLGDCSAFSGLPEAINESQFLTPRLNYDQCFQAITKPARVFGGKVEPALANRLLADSSSDQDQLPLLQNALMRMWRSSSQPLQHSSEPAEQTGPTLGLAEYVAAGGLGTTLSNHADEAFDELNAEQKRIAVALFRALTERGVNKRDTRRPVKLGIVAKIAEVDPDEVAEVVEVFRKPERSFLAPEWGTPLDADSMLDIGHESLIRHWKKLRQWVEEEALSAETYRRLDQTARLWKEQREVPLRGAALDNVLAWKRREKPNAAWAARYGECFELAMEFLKQSELAQRNEQEQKYQALYEDYRENIRLRFATSAAVIAALIALGAIVLATWAFRQRRIAQSRELATAATLKLEADPVLSLLLAVEAANKSATVEADAVLRQALFESHVRAAFSPPANAVTNFAISSDGRLVISGLKDRNLAIWEPGSTGNVVTVATGGKSVSAVALSPDGRFLVISADDNTARVLEVSTSKMLAELTGHTDAIKSVAFSSDAKLILTTSLDNTARVWDRGAGKNLAIGLGHEGGITSAAFSPDSELVVSTTTVGTAHIWEARTGRVLTNLIGHTRWINTAAFSPDGRRVVTASEDNTARVWEAESGQQLAVLSSHTKSLNSASFSPDGLLVVTASKDENGRVWVAETGEPIAVLRGHRSDVLSATFTTGGQSVVSLGADNTVRKWDAGAGRLIARHDNPVNCAALRVEGAFLIAGLSDGTVTVWDTRTGSRLHTNLVGHTAQVTRTPFSPDGQWAITTSAAFSFDGQWAITTTADGSALLWDATTWNLVATPVRPVGLPSSSAAFSPDAKWVAIAGANMTVRIWDVRARQTVTNLVGHTGPVNAALFSPDGRLVLTASDDKTAKLWRSDNWALVASLVHSNAVVASAFSKDSQFVLTANADNQLLRWAARSGSNLATIQLEGTAALSTTVAFSPDGEFIVSTSAEPPFTTTLWKTSTGSLVAQLKGQAGRITSAGFSTDGKLIVTASTDGTVRAYSVEELASLTELLALAQKHLTRGLTPDERRRYLH